MAALSSTYAIASYGTYPNPSIGYGDRTRAILAVSYGLLLYAPGAPKYRGIGKLGFNLTMD